MQNNLVDSNSCGGEQLGERTGCTFPLLFLISGTHLALLM